MSGRSSRQPLAIGTVVVGRRADAGLILLDEHVSEHNAELHWDGDRLRIRDLGSRNGTAVNRQPISDWTDLAQGDTISLGGFEVVDHARFEELGLGQHGFIDNDLDPLGLDPLHYTLDGTGTVIIRTSFHNDAVHPYYRLGASFFGLRLGQTNHLGSNEVFAHSVGIDNGLNQRLRYILIVR